MSVTYSTNWMGVISLSWYKERGLIEEGSVEPTTYYSAGRIDIRGLDSEKYWSGWHEYSLPPMHGKSWNALSCWLDDFTSETLLGYDELIQTFEKDTGHIIEWWKD